MATFSPSASSGGAVDIGTSPSPSFVAFEGAAASAPRYPLLLPPNSSGSGNGRMQRQPNVAHLDHPLIARAQRHARRAFGLFGPRSAADAGVTWDVDLVLDGGGAAEALRAVASATIRDAEREERKALALSATGGGGVGGADGVMSSALDVDSSSEGEGGEGDDESPTTLLSPDQLEALERSFLLSGACNAIVTRRRVASRAAIASSSMMDATAPKDLINRRRQQQHQPSSPPRSFSPTTSPSASARGLAADAALQERYTIDLWDMFDPCLVEDAHRSVVAAHRRYLHAVEGLMAKLQRDFYASGGGGGGGDGGGEFAECGNVPIFIRLAPKKQQPLRRRCEGGGESSGDDEGHEEDDDDDATDPPLLGFPPMLLPMLLDALLMLLPARGAAPRARALLEPYTAEMRRIQQQHYSGAGGGGATSFALTGGGGATDADTSAISDGKPTAPTDPLAASSANATNSSTANSHAATAATPTNLAASGVKQPASSSSSSSPQRPRPLLESLIERDAEETFAYEKEQRLKERRAAALGPDGSGAPQQPVVPHSTAMASIEACRGRTAALQTLGLTCIQRLLLATEEDLSTERERRRLVRRAQEEATAHSASAALGGTKRRASEAQQPSTCKGGHNATLSFVMPTDGEGLPTQHEEGSGHQQPPLPQTAAAATATEVSLEPPAEGPIAFRMACLTDHFEKIRMAAASAQRSRSDSLSPARRKSSAAADNHQTRSSSSNAHSPPPPPPLFPDVLNGPPNTIAFFCSSSATLHASLMALSAVAAAIELSSVACELHSLGDLADRLTLQAGRLEELRRIRKARLRRLEQEAQRAAAMEALSPNGGGSFMDGGLLGTTTSSLLSQQHSRRGHSNNNRGGAAPPSAAEMLPPGYILVNGALVRPPSATEAAVPPLVLFNPSARFAHDWPNAVFAGRCVTTQHLRPLPGGGVVPLALEAYTAAAAAAAAAEEKDGEASTSVGSLPAAKASSGHPSAAATREASTASRSPHKASAALAIGRTLSSPGATPLHPSRLVGAAGSGGHSHSNSAPPPPPPPNSAPPPPPPPNSAPSSPPYDGEDDEPHLSATNLQFVALLVRERAHRRLVDARASEVVAAMWPPRMVFF